MKTKKIKKIIQIEKTIEVNLPYIVKSRLEKVFYKVVSENEMLVVSNYNSHKTIEATDLITIAFNDNNVPATEEEFNEAYNKVMQDIKEKFNEFNGSESK